ncbi:MAG: hypothetical protein ACYTFY_04405 [Planctomycetota bacterium]|jgi:hypothetical protein
MKIASCRPYHAVLSGTDIVENTEEKSVFKVYYLSIIGRDKPEIYEWEKCSLQKDNFKKGFINKNYAGIGFITAFPHITKVFRFAPGMETILDVQAVDTVTLKNKSCERDENYYEFACYAEAVLAADEYKAWADAESIEEYLKYFSKSCDFPVKSSSKLGEYWS